MPASTYLHIQDQESNLIRVVELLPWILVRIGRAVFCEIRIPDITVAEEACRLQRRGLDWFLVPVGAKGSIFIEDRLVEGSCPLTVDVRVRIGNYSLTLRQATSSDPGWGMSYSFPVSGPELSASGSVAPSVVDGLGATD